ncbi:NADH dehydrogenase (ubiquinone) 24 kDa subunit [Desulfonatronospira thiodismutans ASO3-1]|uniref:NADH dehydrogenase (Ubiquinone) 24 kDa subunit n=2 Tax=Desulfonatronospira TaxID=488937 RepID=D6SM91_9BACT|nr:NAD(P)H-dependent oxidoreductase subunit E [Desulfonatronospira thiodismutans]EFI35802.1 NADH dehydrogenase (ubiquinone) 24 kDa subunit [Desulfonatronospira thiodismutans ASO3-1]
MKLEDMNFDEKMGELGAIIGEEERKRGILIPALHEIQNKMGYLDPEELKELSKSLNISLTEIYSVASFYKMFHFKPRGKKIVKVCFGTACYVRGAKVVLDSLSEEFDVKDGETTEDLTMTLETVGCVGCCGLAPVVTCNEEVVGEIDGKKLDAFIDSVKEE